MINYFEFKAIRAAADAPFKTAYTPSKDNPQSVILETFAFGMTYKTQIDLVSTDADGNKLMAAEIADWEGTEEAPGFRRFANLPVESDEVRFYSPHDFSKKYTWDTRTTGKYGEVAGAVTYLDGIPNADVPGEYLYEWRDAQDAVVSKMIFPDGYDKPGKWQVPDGLGGWRDHVIYFPQDPQNPEDPDGDWFVVDAQGAAQGTAITDSTWRIKPYDGYKVVLNLAKVDAPVVAPATEPTLVAPLHFQFFTSLDETLTGIGTATPPMAVKDFVYREWKDFVLGGNNIQQGGVVVFNYLQTKPIVVDSRFNQRIDVFSEGHVRCEDVSYAKATYIGMKVRSF